MSMAGGGSTTPDQSSTGLGTAKSSGQIGQANANSLAGQSDYNQMGQFNNGLTPGNMLGGGLAQTNPATGQPYGQTSSYPGPGPGMRLGSPAYTEEMAQQGQYNIDRGPADIYGGMTPGNGLGGGLTQTNPATGVPYGQTPTYGAMLDPSRGDMSPETGMPYGQLPGGVLGGAPVITLPGLGGAPGLGQPPTGDMSFGLPPVPVNQPLAEDLFSAGKDLAPVFNNLGGPLGQGINQLLQSLQTAYNQPAQQPARAPATGLTAPATRPQGFGPVNAPSGLGMALAKGLKQNPNLISGMAQSLRPAPRPPVQAPRPQPKSIAQSINSASPMMRSTVRAPVQRAKPVRTK